MFDDVDLFFSCLAAPFRVRFRLRIRLRARLFQSFKVKDIKFASPGSLNPWVAAGGREAIRIIETSRNNRKYSAIGKLMKF